MMIEVRRRGKVWCWGWRDSAGFVYRCVGLYLSPDHALRDAWIWAGPKTPALVYT